MGTSILLVDDNAIQAATRKAILERAGWSIVVSSNAPDALQLLENPDFFHSIGLIITDHLMPLMNGPEFVNILRKLFSDVPVLVISGLPDAEEEYDSLSVVFRLKPFAPDQLIHLVRALIAGPMSRTA